MHVTSTMDSFRLLSRRACMCVITYNLRPTGIESARRRLLCGSKSRGRSVAVTYRLRSSCRLEGTGWREGDGRYARATVRAGRLMRVALRSCARNEWRGTSCALGCPLRPLRARARTGSRSFGLRHNATIADVSCFPLHFKGNETIFRRRPLFLSFFGHSGQSGGTRVL